MKNPVIEDSGVLPFRNTTPSITEEKTHQEEKIVSCFVDFTDEEIKRIESAVGAEDNDSATVRKAFFLGLSTGASKAE